MNVPANIGGFLLIRKRMYKKKAYPQYDMNEGR